jgi:hypothetical protein
MRIEAVEEVFELVEVRFFGEAEQFSTATAHLFTQVFRSQPRIGLAEILISRGGAF